MLSRLFAPRRRRNQQEIAGRAAEVVEHVLYDIGIDRFLNGSMMLDARLRLRFFAVTAPAGAPPFAIVPLRELPEALVLRAYVDDVGLDATAVSRFVPLLVEGLMRELLARSPALRALPPRRTLH
ncbi:hypothetical protein B0920_08355 [Massilia sp. KIM]|nr:hypothetical protein B0920_08355 [Massilia sp. KIM]